MQAWIELQREQPLADWTLATQGEPLFKIEPLGDTMNPKAVAVYPLPDYQLNVVFANGEWRIFDVRPYLEHGVFRQLKDTERFSAVRVVAGAVEWPGEIDLSYDTLHLGGVGVPRPIDKLSRAP